MLQFKLLLLGLTLLLKRQISTNPAAARYVKGKNLIFQIRTESGTGRNFIVRNGSIQSTTSLLAPPDFTLSFKDGGKGFKILSAKDSQAAFLRGLGSKELVISGDFLQVMWFQGLTDFLQPPKVVSPYNRSRF